MNLASVSWRERVALLRDEAAHTPVARRAALHLAEVGRIWLDHLGVADEAERAFEEALARDPQASGPLRALTRLAEARGDWDRVRDLLARQLEAASSAADRFALLVRLAGVLQDQLGDDEGARLVLRDAMALDPDDAEVRARLERATPADDVAARLDLLSHRLQHATGPLARAEVLTQMAAVAEGDPEREAEAAAHHRRALEAHPGHAPALRGLGRLYVRDGRWEDLVAMLAEAAPHVTDDALRGRLVYTAAVVQVARLEAPERARPLLGQAALLLSDDAAALRELAADYEQLGMWGPANALLERLAERSDDWTAAGAWYRAGLNAETGLGRPDQAFAAWRRALEVDPTFVPALAALRRHAWSHDDFEGADAASEALAGLAPDAETRAALLTHRARAAEARGGEPEARWWEALQVHLETPPGEPAGVPPPLRALVLRLAERGDPQAAATLLERWLERPLTARARSWVVGHLADLYEHELGRADQALGLHRTWSTLARDDARPLHAMAGLLAAAGDDTALADVLERAADVEPDPPRRLALLDRVAALHEARGKPEAAEAAWRRMIEAAPGDLRALHGLGRLLYHHGRWSDLADLLRGELASLAPDDPRRAGLLGRLAELCEFHLERPEEAAAAYEAVLELKPQAPDALAGLERLYGARDRWQDLARTLRRRADRLQDPRDRAAVLFRLAEIEHEQLGRLEESVDLYDTALQLAPGLLPATWALERLAIARGERDRLLVLYRTLLPRLESRGQRAVVAHKLAALLTPLEARQLWEEILDDAPDDAWAAWALARDAAERGDRAALAARLATLAQHVGERHDAVALWREAAEAAEDAGLTVEERIALWERVLPLDPVAPRPWEALLRAYRELGDPAALSSFLTRLARASDDDRARSVAWWAAGHLEEAAGDVDRATALYEEAHAACADDPVPAWRLLELARARLVDDTPAARTVYAARLEEAARRQRGGRAAARWLNDAGDVWLLEPAGPDRALACFLEGVRRDPLADDCAAKAEALLRDGSRWGELEALLQGRLRRLEGHPGRADLARRLAALQSGILGDREAARATLRTLVELQPGDVDARLRLGELAAEDGLTDEAARHFERAAAATTDEALLARLLTRLGRLRAHALGDVPGAIADLRRAVGLLDPEARALEALAEVYLLGGDAEASLRAWRQLERIVDDPARSDAARAGQARALAALGRAAPAPSAPIPAPEPVEEVPAPIEELPEEPPPRRTAAWSPPIALPEATADVDEAPAMAPESVVRPLAVTMPVPVVPVPPSPAEEQRSSTATEVGMPAVRLGRVAVGPAAPSSGGDDAARRARARIEESPLDAGAWEALGEATALAGDAAGAAWLAGVHDWLAGHVAPGAPVEAPGAVPESLRRPLLPVTVPAPVLGLLRAVAEAVGPAFAAEPAGRGADEAIPDDDPLVTTAARLGRALAAPPVTIRRNPARPYTVAVEPGAGPTGASIALGSAILAGGDPSGCSFLMARCLVPLAEGTLVARRLTDREFGAFLGALLTLLGAEHPVRPRDRATFERMMARLEPLLPLERRMGLSGLARAAAEGLPAFPAAAIRIGLETYAARLALALSDGFGGAFEMLRLLDFDDRSRGALDANDVAQFVADSDLARDLLVFAASPACLAIRSWLATSA